MVCPATSIHERVPMKQNILCILLLVSFLYYALFSVSCTPIQQHSRLSETAIKTTEAAVFYFEHGDYQKSKELCMEALTIWSKMQSSTSRYPSWLIERNIDDCNLLLKRIKRIQSPDPRKNISI